MRFPTLNKKSGLALLGIALIAFGGANLLRAQRQTDPQVIRLSSGGAYLGIEMEDVTADNMAKYKLAGETGVIVRSVEKGSPAETAHLQENDVILEYCGIPVFSMAELTRLVAETPVSRTVSLVVSRDGKKSNFTIKIGDRSDGTLSGRFGVITRDNLVRRFDLTQPGGGVFKFSVPRGDRSFNLVVPFRPQLGVTVEAVTDQMATFLGLTGKQGLLVTSVTQGSPAAPVLRAGDVILSIDGRPIATPSDLTQALAKKEPGSKADLRVVREKKEISVSVEFPKSTAPTRGVRV